MAAPRTRIGRLVDVDGASVHVCDDGPRHAATVLLIHGLSGSVHWYDAVAADLAQTVRVLRVDLGGHGCTTSRSGLDAPEQSRVVSQLLQQLDVQDVLALGHSFGADVAIGAAELTDRITRVAVLAQAPDYSYASFPRARYLLTWPGLGPLLHRMASSRAVRSVGRIGYAPGFSADRSFDHRDRPVWDHHATDPAMFRVVIIDRKRRLAARPLDTRLAELGRPALAILGRHDQMYDCAQTSARYAAVGARVVVVEDAGHSPNVERPTEVAAAIRDFLGSS